MVVLIVEDNPEMARHLELCLSGIENVRNILIANNKSAGISLLEAQKPELLICDLCLPDGSGIEVIARSAMLNIPSLVVSVLFDETTVLRAIESGANGYLLKETEPEQVQSAVMEVLSGGAPVTPSIASHLLKRVREDKNSGTISNQIEIDLSKREHEVLQLAARGFKISEIASCLNISQHTVSNHNRAVYRKLRVNSKSQAIYKAFKCGLISD